MKIRCIRVYPCAISEISATLEFETENGMRPYPQITATIIRVNAHGTQVSNLSHTKVSHPFLPVSPVEDCGSSGLSVGMKIA